MPKDVLITPASSKIEFKDVSSNIDGLIQLDGSDNLSITSPNGVLNLGNAAGHVYIGDGTNVTDLIFDQSGTIKAATGKTLTIGQTGSNVTFTGTVSSLSNITIGPSAQYGRINNTDPYHAIILRGSTDAAGTITAGNTMEFAEFGGIWRFKAINGTTMTTALDMSTTAATFNGTVSGTRLISTVATGTAPLTVSSTTVVTNLNADLLNGLQLHTGTNNEANKIVRTDGNGYIQAGWINTISGDNGTTAITRIYASNDNYIRTYSPANFRTAAGIAAIDSPAFTGTPTAPTATAGTNTTQIATTAFVQTAVNNVTLNTQTASYQLVLADAGKVIEMNVATANNLTVPLNSSVPFPIGTSIDIVQYGAGQTTIVAAGGVTIRSSGNKLKLTGQYSAATLYKRGTDEWVVMGDLTS